MLNESEIRSLVKASTSSRSELKNRAQKIKESIHFTFGGNSPHLEPAIKELEKIVEELAKMLPEVSEQQIRATAQQNYRPTPTTKTRFTNHSFRRFKELIPGESQSVALQIYHPKGSKLHSDPDRRILNLKNGGNAEIELYAEAVAQVLPTNRLIYLAAVPPSSPNGGQSLKRLIRQVTNRSELYKDLSSILKTTKIRGKKAQRNRFTDEELAQTIDVEKQPIDHSGVIILLDDVVTTGQSFRVCRTKLRQSGIANDILHLAMAKTDRHSQQKGIADTLHSQQLTSISSAHTPRTSQSSRPPSPDIAHSRERAGQTTPRKSNSQIKQKTRHTQHSQRQTTTSSKDECFVITAIYDGNRRHPNVQALRRWRDKKLTKSMGGRFIIDTYYHIGPGLARAVKSLHLTKPLRSILEAIMKNQQS